LQADNSTVVVSGIAGSAQLNGTPVMALPFFQSIIDYVAHTSFHQPVVTLDGSVMDLVACGTAQCSEGMGFESSGVFAYPFVITTPAFGSLNYEPYQASNWNLSPVPEISSLLLMGLGLTLLIGLRRRA
jgi:hypothetical protein